MKFVLLAALCASTLAFVVIDEKTAREQLSGQALADYVNSVQSLFVAENVEMSDAEKKFKIMDGKYAAGHTPKVLASARAEVLASIPASFDSRSQWSHCNTIKLVRDQATCGSCWAFSSAEVISDRTCIHSNGNSQPELSAEDILSCCGSTCGNGCEGGYPIEAFRFWDKKGVVTGGDYKGSGCKPYPFAPCSSSSCPESKTPSCTLACQSGYSNSYNKDKHFGSTAYAVSNNVAAIQTEILTNGPVVGAFKVYNDFYQYKGGVYKHTAGSYLGGHAIKIIGWGTDNGTPYWLIANSWGNSWGEKGFFRMLRGANECNIEAAIVAGIAK